MMNWDIELVRLIPSKHFKLKWMCKWNLDFDQLRDAIASAYRIDQVGSEKFEIYCKKKGYKKIIVVYSKETDELYCITGSQGGRYEKMPGL